MKTPPRTAFARYAHDVTSSPFGAGVASGEAAQTGVLAYLQDQLIANGYLSRPLDTASWSERETQQLEKCLNAMLAKAADAQGQQAHLMAKFRNLSSEYTRMESQATRDRQALMASEHEKESAKAQAQSASKDLAAETARHAIAKEEVSKARLALQAVKAAAQYEAKRKENELSTLAARLTKISAAPPTIACITVNPQDALSRQHSSPFSPVSQSGRSTPSSSSAHAGEIQLLEQSLKDLDASRCAMQEENLQLRELVGDVMSEVQATLTAMGLDQPELAEQLSNDILHTPQPHFALPAATLASYLEKLFLKLRDGAVDSVSQADAKLEEEIRRHGEMAEERIGTLEKELETKTSALAEAEHACQEAQQQVAALTAQEDARAHQVAQDQSEERAELRKQRKQLEHERRKFTTAATRLAQEKEDLDKERLAFVEEQLADEKRRQERREQKAKLKEKEEKRAQEKDRKTREAVAEKAEATKEASHGQKEQSAASRRSASNTTSLSTTTSTTLAKILSSAKDTPPNRTTLSSRQPVPQGQAAKPAAEPALQKKASSASLMARDRVQQAVQAARARSSGEAHPAK